MPSGARQSADHPALGGIVAPRPGSARADEVCLSKHMPGSPELVTAPSTDMW